MSRWTTTEVALLVQAASRARTADELRALFTRHTPGGVRCKARRCGLTWPARPRRKKHD